MSALPPGLEDDIDPNMLTELMMQKQGSNGAAAPPPAEPSPQDEPFSKTGLINEKEATVEIKAAEEWADADLREALMAAESWDSLGLSKELLQGIYEKGFTRPSRIQAAALPYICPPKSRNMIGQAQNGSGKTATFSLGMLSNIDPKIPAPQAIVLCHTRELAKQTEDVVSALGKFMGLSIFTMVTGAEQIPKGKCPHHVIIGTPGKVFNMVKTRVLNVDKVKCFVLDEADVMLNLENQMGQHVSNTRKFLPKELQILFFSATYPDHVREFAEKIVPNAAKIIVKNLDLSVDAIKQMYLRCRDREAKYAALKDLYSAMNVGQSIIFMNSRKGAFQLAQRLKSDGSAVSLICGTQMTGPERVDNAMRDKVMQEFRDGVTKVLVSTDVLARGIDVPAVTLVINYEMPLLWEDGVRAGDREGDGHTYLHRIGRTGRFGLKGVSINLVDDHELKLFKTIQDKFGCTATEVDPDFELLEEQIRKCRK